MPGAPVMALVGRARLVLFRVLALPGGKSILLTGAF